ncbi:MAG: hypothetical protein RI580_06655 [Halothece sp. Uz-M2-17]|nr:hypothetical protein [Halothece sp. Uz-M2-17]
MFEQFRTHFPKGSLISELIQIDHGKYIVRASVQNEGLTLATGLAAADTVEQAEDKARDRALAVLNISLSPPITQAKQESREKPIPPSAEKQLDNSSKSGLSQAKMTEEKPFSSDTAPTPINEKSETEVQGSMEWSDSSSWAKDLPTGADAEQHSEPEVNNKNHVSTQTEGEKTASSASEEVIMDNSDIIARTNVELRRLNWTSEQGRKFLEETYGKRSRSLLSESELREFLEYLEKQPTPQSDQ